MRIAIDISQIAYQGSGVGRFTEGLVKAICKYDNQNEWIFFYSSLRRSIDASIKEVIEAKNFSLIESKLPPTLLGFVWNKLHFFQIDRIIGEVDWLITSDWTEPPSKNRKATIVHDLVYLKYPETVDSLVRTTQENRLHWVLKESSIIFADSDSTKHDLETMLFFDKNKIVVNYPGVYQEKVSSIKYQVSKERPFILTVGKREPRKNLERLVEAFKQLKRDDIDLYIVGMDGWGKVSIENDPQIKLLGFVSDDKLMRLYRSCLLFVMPSLYEGFGYPVIEAMSCGAPVATSNSSSLREIAGNAAVLFDPLSVESMVEGLKKIINSPDLRKELSKKGLNRSSEFTWKNYYDTMIKVLSSKF